MEPTTRWETAALRASGGRPRPRVTQTGGEEGGEVRAPTGPDGGEDADVGPPPPATGTGETEALLVPLSAWNRMLDQLGNLHEAGRELAEARERAARAETEAAFLRERLAELRAAEAAHLAPAEAGGMERGRVDVAGGGSAAGSGLIGVGRRAAAAAGGWIRRRGI